MFKKNKDVAVSEASKESGSPGSVTPKATSRPNGDQAMKSQKIKSLNSWGAQPVFAMIFCMLLAYVLLELLYLKPMDSLRQSETAAARIQSVEFSVSRYFKSQKEWLSGLSKAHYQELEGLVSTLKSVNPELQALHVLSPEQLNQSDVQHPELTFASVDLLRRVVKGEQISVEAFLQDQKWLYQIAVPVFAESVAPDEKEKKTVALVLGIFEMSALQSLLRDKQAQVQGQIALLANGLSKPLLEIGAGNTAAELDAPIAIPQWRIKYAPPDDIFVQADRVNVWFVFLAAMLLLAVILVILIRINMKTVQRDLQSAVKMISKAVEGEAKFLNNFHYGEVYAMASAIVGHVRQIIAHQKTRISKLQGVKATKAETIELSEDEPLFDDDLFDLDTIDQDSAGSSAIEGALVQEKTGLGVNISPSIFRAYDIRGVVDETLNTAVVEILGKAIASEALAQGQTRLCIGYDGRHSSPQFCESLAQGALSCGIDVIIIGRVPTPVLYFATHHFETGSGVMITGSHNPSQYNGLKIMIAGTTLSGEAIQKLHTRVLTQDFTEGQGQRTAQSVDRAYMDSVLNDIAVAAPLKVVVDAGNGIAGVLAPELIEELGCEVIPLHCEVDGNFPNHHPDPGKPENLKDLIAAVKEHQADIGLAFDGDGDRLGVVTNSGKIIWPDRLLMLFAKDVVSRNPGADIIYDVKCSRRLNGLISSYGGRPVMWKTGHSLMKAKMKETGALLAGEMSGHIFFKERWFGFDDGLYSAARLLEILGVEDKSSDEVFAEFPDDVSTPEINIPVTDESKFEIIEKLIARKDQFVGGNVTTIDGVRVDYPTGWGLCRASNTTPVLVLRFEADDQLALEEIKNKFKVQLKQIDPALGCDF
jgi:phosphomannomutase/phosphoglucomutase